MCRPNPGMAERGEWAKPGFVSALRFYLSFFCKGLPMKEICSPLHAQVHLFIVF